MMFLRFMLFFFHALSIEVFQSVLSLQGSSLSLCLLYRFCCNALVNVSTLYPALSRGRAFVQTLAFGQHLSGLSICCGKNLGHLWVSYSASWCQGTMQAWPCRWRVNPNWVLCCERAVVIVRSPLDGCASGRAQCSVGAMALLFEYCPVCKGEEVPDTSAVLAAVWCWSGAIPLLQGNTLVFHCCCLWEVYCWGF